MNSDNRPAVVHYLNDLPLELSSLFILLFCAGSLLQLTSQYGQLSHGAFVTLAREIFR